MKKRYYIQLISSLLLLIYLFSSSPSILFHHHNSDSVSVQSATSGEDANFIADHGEKCTHKTQITTAFEKCWLCDNHTASPHALQSFLTAYFYKEFKGSFFQFPKRYYFQTPFSSSNRGPPAVSSSAV